MNSQTKTPSKPRVLVVGGGFGGIKAAMELARSKHFTVTLLSDRPNFYYYPTLYRAATGGVARQSCIPLQELLAEHDIKLALGSAKSLNRRQKIITDAAGKEYAYDVLILSLGVVTNYFGIQGMKKYSYGIKSPDDAQRFKQHLHDQLLSERKPDLNYVVVGGGATGIELAGALPGYLREIMTAHGMRRRAVHVDLVEAAPRLLPRMPKTMSRAIKRRLRKLGVKVYLNSTVQGVTADDLTINGKPIQSHTVIWTAGIANNPFFSRNRFVLNERGKVTVNEYLEAEENIFVIGDNAATPHSGVAQTALHDALFVTDNLIRAAEGRLIQRYTPKTPVYVIPAGERWAAVLWGKVQLYGIAGWLLRSAADLIGFSDFQPWWKAAEQWAMEFQSEENCETCVEFRSQT